MIRPALTICRERRLETAAAVFALSLALFLPGVLATVWAVSNDVASTWLESYEPIVYLEADVSEAQITGLESELAGWSTVEEVTRRSPEQAHRELQGELSEETVAELGVSPSMLPHSLILTPSAPVGGHVDLVASVSALEAREIVAAIEIPDESALRVLTLSGIFAVLALLLLVLGLAAATTILAGYLRRLLEAETSMNDAIELFGAPAGETGRPTVLRGVSLGFWAGAMASLLLVVGLFLIHGFVVAKLGIRPSMGLAWPVAAMPFLAGGLIGLVTGLWVASPGRRPSQLSVEPMLKWETI